ncbi:MAG: cyclase family protein, partial [Planctomycetota bacterium]
CETVAASSTLHRHPRLHSQSDLHGQSVLHRQSRLHRRRRPLAVRLAALLAVAFWMGGTSPHSDWSWSPGSVAIAQTPNSNTAVTRTNIAQSRVEADGERPLGWVDLSLLVSQRWPAFWPVGGLTPYTRVPRHRVGPQPLNRDLIFMDEHTGTQWDAPAHFVPPPNSGLAGAGPMGLVTSEKVPIWQFFGEACVIDITRHIDDARPGESFLITPEIVQAWEEQHRPLGPGDIVLFRSDYSDRYYKPLPAGRRFVETALAQETPGWPGPTPECMKYLGEKKVTAAGIDSASMGPLPNLAAATHQAGGQYGLIWAECLTGLGQLPATGGFYALLAAKHAGGSGGEARAIAIADESLAAPLIAAAKAKRVYDLSVLLDEDYPITFPGDKPGTEGTRYLGKTLNKFDPSYGPFFARTHTMDSHVGTHLVPTACALPADAGFNNSSYPADIQALMQKYELSFGPRASGGKTADKTPLEQTCGLAHVVDVRQLVGTTEKNQWPASPLITRELLESHEAEVRKFRPGEIVVLWSGYSTQHNKKFPEGKRLYADAIAGDAEAWPALDPLAIKFFAERGIRCVATDSPQLGSVRRDESLPLYWAAASRDICLIEFLTNVEAIASKPAYLIFAPIKIEGNHGGHGRAVALLAE